ncbi:MAG: polysaccharide biosynthesis/export family protein [Muribaculaceae bacterium]|nr:polysaccharide biosynthesis/export family protein [Muribaculaceae bacterium]
MNTDTLRRAATKLLLTACTAAMLALSACNSQQKVVYIEDIQPNKLIALQEDRPIRLKPGDKLSIIVHSRDKEIVSMFNLTTGSASDDDDHANYTVNEEGNIDIPVLGPINVNGLTRTEVSNLIKYKLLANKLVRDPTVSVNYADMGYYVLGEVGSPGRKKISRDKINLLEAIAESGDLTINGLRENVLVLRTIDGQQVPYTVDLTKVESLYGSPAYYVQQDDFIYVLPNQKRRNENDWNANSTHSPTFWFSMFTMITTVVLIFVK